MIAAAREMSTPKIDVYSGNHCAVGGNGRARMPIAAKNTIATIEKIR
jgi:hypothetical protein